MYVRLRRASGVCVRTTCSGVARKIARKTLIRHLNAEKAQRYRDLIANRRAFTAGLLMLSARGTPTVST